MYQPVVSFSKLSWLLLCPSSPTLCFHCSATLDTVSLPGLFLLTKLWLNFDQAFAKSFICLPKDTKAKLSKKTLKLYLKAMQNANETL